jgi:hypothetical protein
MVLDHNGLFARRIPFAFSGFAATDIYGFFQRRFGLIPQFEMQQSVEVHCFFEQ